MTPWEIKGRELVNCSCEYGCNCQFNALPDKGHCHAVAGIQIDQGTTETLDWTACESRRSSSGPAPFTKAMARPSLSSMSRLTRSSARRC